MHVGVRTTGRKRRKQVFVSGRMRWDYFFEVFREELHPTKGWRPIGRKRTAVSEHLWRKAPKTEQRFERQRPKVSRGFSTMEPDERAKLRHAWYRREKERQARAAAQEAWNAS